MQVNLEEALFVSGFAEGSSEIYGGKNQGNYSCGNRDRVLKAEACQKSHVEEMHHGTESAINHKCKCCDKVFSTKF